MNPTNIVAQENVTRVDAYVVECPYCGLKLPMGGVFDDKPYATRDQAEQALVKHLAFCSSNPTSESCCDNCIYGVEMGRHGGGGACTKLGVKNVSYGTVCPQHIRRLK